MASTTMSTSSARTTFLQSETNTTPSSPDPELRSVLRQARVTLMQAPPVRRRISSPLCARISAVARPTVPYPTMPTRTSLSGWPQSAATTAASSISGMHLLQSPYDCSSIGLHRPGKMVPVLFQYVIGVFQHVSGQNEHNGVCRFHES